MAAATQGVDHVGYSTAIVFDMLDDVTANNCVYAPGPKFGSKIFGTNIADFEAGGWKFRLRAGDVLRVDVDAAIPADGSSRLCRTDIDESGFGASLLRQPACCVALPYWTSVAIEATA